MLQNFTVLSLLTVLWGVLSMGARAQDPSAADKAKVEAKAADTKSADEMATKEGEEEEAEEKEDTGGLQAAKFMPLGRPNLKVKIPQFEDGELQCVMNAEEMTRVGDEDIDIKSMDMEFMEDGVAVTRIELLDARYNLTDKLIKTDKRAVVQRNDFTLVGASLEFDSAGQRGTMKGKVRMVIHDTSGFSGKKEDEADAKAGDAAAEEVGLSVVEAARMIARVADYQRRQQTETGPTP